MRYPNPSLALALLTFLSLLIVGASAKAQVQARAWVHSSNGSGFDYQSSIDYLAGFSAGQRWITGDFNGDGADDLVNVYGKAQSGSSQQARAWLHISTAGAGFRYRDGFTTFAGFWDDQRWLAGDFDGDGLDDLVNVYGAKLSNGSLRTRAWVHLATGSGFEHQSSISSLAGFSTAQRWLVGDFNGDGLDDLVNVYGRTQADGSQQARAWVHLSTGAGFEYQSGFTTFAGFWNAQAWLVGDFNGDGLDDLINVYGRSQPDGSQQARAWVHHSYGSSFEYQSNVTTLAGFWSGQRWRAGDFNGDGIDDLVNVYGKAQPDGSQQARAWVHESHGDGFYLSSNLTPFAGFWSGQRWLTGDFDNDQRDDLVNVYGGRERALPDLTARSAIVVDRATGGVLGVKNPDERVAMASTTKIMTALLAVEAIGRGEIALDDIVVVSSGNDASTVGGTCMNISGMSCPNGGLQVGERLSLRDLLYGVMLRSGNEAANTLAAFVSGSVSDFVTLMNQRAEELGMEDTSFVTPHGRDPEDLFGSCDGDEFDEPQCAHYSTARDLARLASVALNVALFAQIVRTDGYFTTTRTTSAGVSRNGRLCTTNRLVRNGATCSSSASAYSGAYGVKTGTTGRAGSCLVSAARRSSWLGSKDVIAVVLGADANDAMGGDRYTDSREILDAGLDRATLVTPVLTPLPRPVSDIPLDLQPHVGSASLR